MRTALCVATVHDAAAAPAPAKASATATAAASTTSGSTASGSTATSTVSRSTRRLSQVINQTLSRMRGAESGEVACVCQLQPPLAEPESRAPHPRRIPPPPEFSASTPLSPKASACEPLSASPACLPPPVQPETAASTASAAAPAAPTAPAAPAITVNTAKLPSPRGAAAPGATPPRTVAPAFPVTTWSATQGGTDGAGSDSDNDELDASIAAASAVSTPRGGTWTETLADRTCRSCLSFHMSVLKGSVWRTGEGVGQVVVVAWRQRRPRVWCECVFTLRTSPPSQWQTVSWRRPRL